MEKPIRLHLGCGPNYFEGYINIDYPPSEHTNIEVKADIYQDIRTLSYEENSVDEIRSHHMLEHFSRQEALKLLITWRRWLKPGGIIHLETPDFSTSAFWYAMSLSRKRRFELSRHIFGSQDAKWAYHYDGWDKSKFKFVLKQLGFKKIRVRSFANSAGKRYPKIPFFGFFARFLPRAIYKKYGGNKLPDVVAIAQKSDNSINEKQAITNILKLSLVGPDGDNLLNQWLKDIDY